MIEAEFLVQALQMRTGVWNPSFSGAVNDLRIQSRISPEDAHVLQTGYDFLRRCESVLRRWENKGVAALPSDENEQRKLARRFGARDVDSFGADYLAARETIHAVYLRYFS
jgi:glutamine synthetase adenylyltransferase